jgi:hypothetical protein
MFTAWKQNDIPWRDHAVGYPSCVFVRYIKGDQFIRECQQQTIIDEPHLEHEIPMKDALFSEHE